MAYILSKKTGKKYLSVSDCEKLQKQIEKIVARYGLKVKTQFHPTYIEVPIQEEPKEKE